MKEALPKRLCKNRNGYLGEPIDLDAILNQLVHHTEAQQWNTEKLPFNKTPEASLLYLESYNPNKNKKILLTGGIHGDEPATTAAIAQLILQNELPSNHSYCIFPCLNPNGMRQGTRENADGVDLNRDYFKQQTNEVQTQLRKLETLPRFDVALLLHEDWESSGFYLYELSKENEPAIYGRNILDKVSSICPIETAGNIEGMPADHGLIHPKHRYLDRDDWPEAFYMMQHKTDNCLTLEAPSDFELNVRVKALITAVQTAIKLTLG